MPPGKKLLKNLESKPSLALCCLEHLNHSQIHKVNLPRDKTFQDDRFELWNGAKISFVGCLSFRGQLSTEAKCNWARNGQGVTWSVLLDV